MRLFSPLLALVLSSVAAAQLYPARTFRVGEGWPDAAYADLVTGYQLLRMIESRLRIVGGRAVSQIPDGRRSRRELARRLGYVDTPRQPAEVALLGELRYHREAIRRRFDEVLEVDR